MTTKPMHFVLVPLMAQGHIIPTVDLARLLAERGVLVSVITTPFNLSRLRPTVDRVEQSGLPIEFVPLEFPAAEWGLPDGCENLDVLPSSGDYNKVCSSFLRATASLTEPLKSYIRNHNPSLSTCLVSDFCLPWTRNVSSELGIPRLVFYSICCFTLCCYHFSDHHDLSKGYDTVTDESDLVVFPGLPRHVEIPKARALGFFPEPEYEFLRDEVLDAERTADGFVVNTFVEMERDYVGVYQDGKRRRVYAVGPVSLCNRGVGDRTARGGRPSLDEDKIMSWLDSMAEASMSVIYASLGTLVRPSPAQLVEIGTGLEASGHPFIWVISDGGEVRMREVEEWLRSGGFEERNRERGLVIRGWAPQAAILSHPAVGGFLTHCGWNSCMEGVAAGLPMLTWPCFGDQFLNEKFVTEVLGAGVPVGAKAEVLWWSDGEVLVERGQLAGAVEKLMGGSEEAEQRKRRAAGLGESARKAMEVGGSSYVGLSLLLEDALRLASTPSRIANDDDK